MSRCGPQPSENCRWGLPPSQVVYGVDRRATSIMRSKARSEIDELADLVGWRPLVKAPGAMTSAVLGEVSQQECRDGIGRFRGEPVADPFEHLVAIGPGDVTPGEIGSLAAEAGVTRTVYVKGRHAHRSEHAGR
jgi:hypothetical protein